MKLYRIRNWNDLFENNRSRTVKDLSWVAIPNRHDGENFSTIMMHKHGAEIFAAWVLILQVASRCQPRGTLLRDNKKPHTAVSLSMKTRAPLNWFETAFKFLESDTDWLDVENVAVDWQEGDSAPTSPCQSGDEEGKEGKGMELKGMEVAASPSNEEKKLSKSKGSCDEVKAYALELELPESDGQWFFDKCEGNGWKNNGKPIADWKATIRSWKTAKYLPSQRQSEFQSRGGFVTPAQQLAALTKRRDEHPCNKQSVKHTGNETEAQWAEYREIKASIDTVTVIISKGGAK